MINEDLKELIGYEGDIIYISNKFQTEGYADICDSDNLEELLNDGNIVLWNNESQDYDIQIFFDIITLADTTEEDITASTIKITNIVEY